MSSLPASSFDAPIFPPPSAAEVSEASSSPVPANPGHKFPLPALPLPSNAHKNYRYDPVVKQLTNLLMKDGKLSVAQTNMGIILSYLRTASPPNYSPTRPLLPGARKSRSNSKPRLEKTRADISLPPNSPSIPPPPKPNPLHNPRPGLRGAAPAHPLPTRRSRRRHGAADPRAARPAPAPQAGVHVGA